MSKNSKTESCAMLVTTGVVLFMLAAVLVCIGLAVAWWLACLITVGVLILTCTCICLSCALPVSVLRRYTHVTDTVLGIITIAVLVCTVVQFSMLALKLAGVLTIAWVLVLTPLFVYMLLVSVILAVAAIINRKEI